jgi:hypothetical protein
MTKIINVSKYLIDGGIMGPLSCTNSSFASFSAAPNYVFALSSQNTTTYDQRHQFYQAHGSIRESLAPVIDMISYAASNLFSMVSTRLSAIDKALTFPVAHAATNQNDQARRERMRQAAAEGARKAAEAAKTLNNIKKTVKNPSGFYNNMVVPELQKRAEQDIKKLKVKVDDYHRQLEQQHNQRKRK